MAVETYRKFKISLRHDSKKTQGLKTGDIVRRQYFDGKNLIYSVMCVLDYGTEQVRDAETGAMVNRNYFIGALLEGDAPQQEEILDFARITNLFDESRSGALYLTSSDDQSPYMDVIDNIGRNESLCWPENVAGADYQDSMSQYVITDDPGIKASYIPSINDNNRVVRLKAAGANIQTMGIHQDFYKYVENPNRVLISFKVRSSRNMTCGYRLGYTNEAREDGAGTFASTTEWTYQLFAITVDWSGRHLRTVSVEALNPNLNDELEIADFNVILLSSVLNYQDASQIRVGKLTGVVDPVFGQLDSYGGYFQKLFASGSAHVSGTLTAGDENGFAATFYAGKIHRNAFLNSLDIDFTTGITVERQMTNPVGVGHIYASTENVEMKAQTNSWLMGKVGKKYCFSFWVYAKQQCQISIVQNQTVVGVAHIPVGQTHKWVRKHVCFDIQLPETDEDDMLMLFVPTWGEAVEATGLQDADTPAFYITAPQLEAGDTVTQYQPTDEILNLTEDYGAWFSRGGIGGTIQNPLLQLNFDGNGSIGTRTKSFMLRVDGSGYLANMNIVWDERGKVTFTDQVTLSWVNLDNTVQNNIISKSVKITGGDTFTMMGDESSSQTSFFPTAITLSVTEENIQTTSSQRQWFYLKDGEFKQIPRANAKTLQVLPDSAWWGENESQLTVKYEAQANGNIYSDSFTIRKQHIVGYEVKVVSEKGDTFKNGVCSTVLTANVYYQGKLVADSFIEDNFNFVWKKYHLPDTDHEVVGWWDEIEDDDGNVIQPAIDRTAKTITLNCEIKGQDLYICELQNGSSIFPYTFPIIFA